MPGRRGDGAPSTGAGPAERPLDGRLDLDHLDAPVDLDVLGHGAEGPSLVERTTRALASTRVARAARRHRRRVAVAVLVVALAAAGGMRWWGSRPTPLPAAADVLVSASGPDATQVTVYSVDGRLDSLMLRVDVSSAEAPGVAVELLGLAGPGLAPPGGAGWSLDPQAPGPTGSSLVPGSLECDTDASVGALLVATPDDYGVLVRRTSATGETRVDRVPLVGAQHLSAMVRTACLQAAAARDLRVVDVTANTVAGVAAADVHVLLRSTGTLAWPGLRAAPEAQPWLTNDEPAVDLGPGGAATLALRLWAQDCAAPVEALAPGLALQSDAATTFTLPLDASQKSLVARAFTGVCSGPAPTLTVEQSTIATGADLSSAGTVELTVGVRATSADLVEVDVPGAALFGQLTPLDAPVHLVHGSGTLHLAWILPRCADLVATGLPALSVSLVTFNGAGGLRHPYVVGLTGDALRVELRRACGDAAAALVR